MFGNTSPRDWDGRDWAIGVLTALLLSFITFHVVTTATLQARVATLDERSKNRYEQIKVQRQTQEGILAQLGGIVTRLDQIQASLDTVSLGILTTRSTVDEHSKQLVRLMVLTRPRS